MISACRNRVLLVLALIAATGGADWRQFRGSDSTGVYRDRQLPATFQEDVNVAWKIPLPGRGPSSPIVVGDRVLVTSCSGPRRDRLHVLCFRCDSGELLWERQLWATGSTHCNAFGGVAANTPASDGRRVFAMFSSNDLACFDLDGRLRWLRGFSYETPELRNDVGMAASPLVIDQTVIVQCESQGAAFIAGVDAATGETRWRREQTKTAAWCSPTLLAGDSPADSVVLVQCPDDLSALQPHTGEVLWRFEAKCHTTASPATSGNRIFLPAEAMYALEYDPATRSVRKLWEEVRLRSASASPVAHDGRLYVIKSSAILVCGDAATGRVLWQLRLKGPVWATPMLAGNRLYAVNHEGLVQTVEVGDVGKLVGTSQLDPEMLASPAAANGAIYFRSNRRLWKVALD